MAIDDLRIKIRNVLLRHTRLKVERANWVADAVLAEVGRAPFGTVEDHPVPGCACWACVLQLHAAATMHRARLEVERESELEVD